jgi:hypothetical protein
METPEIKDGILYNEPYFTHFFDREFEIQVEPEGEGEYQVGGTVRIMLPVSRGFFDDGEMLQSLLPRIDEAARETGLKAAREQRIIGSVKVCMRAGVLRPSDMWPIPDEEE